MTRSGGFFNASYLTAFTSAVSYDTAAIHRPLAQKSCLTFGGAALSAEMIMSKQNNGGPAFPEIGNVDCNSDWQSESGMTLRDYFAAKAMQAIVDVSHSPELFANHAYKIADAMLRAREAS